MGSKKRHTPLPPQGAPGAGPGTDSTSLGITPLEQPLSSSCFMPGLEVEMGRRDEGWQSAALFSPLLSPSPPHLSTLRWAPRSGPQLSTVD